MSTLQLIEIAADPTVSSDSANLSVQAGTLWRNTSTGNVFLCTNPARGAAVWKKITAQPWMNNVQAAGTTLAPSAAQSGSRFIVTNAASVTVTLPAVAENLVYEFLRAADEEMVITAASAGDLVVGGDLAANSVTFTTAGQHIGAVVRVEGILVGTTPKWLVTIPTAPYSTGALLALALAT
jgi:hypothetical protein